MAIAGLAVPLLILLAAFGYLSLHRTSVTLVRSLFGGWADQKGFRKWFLKAIGFNALVKVLKYVEARVRSAISHAAAVHLATVTGWLNGMHAVAHETYRELGAIAHDAATGYDWIIRHTLPGQIARRTAPIRANVKHATATAEGAAVLGKDTRRISFKGIDKLRREMGLLAGILLGIDILVKKGHGRERHHADHTRTIPAHTRDIGRLKARDKIAREEAARTQSRLKRIEKALGLGVFAALIYRVLARVAPWLFCRNVKKLGNVACGIRPDTLNALTALLLGTMAISNLETLARFAAAVEEDVAREVKDLLGA